MFALSPIRAARRSALLLALPWLGCSSPLERTTRPPVTATDATRATETSQGFSAFKSGLYPLALENRWSYRRLETIQLITFGEPPPPPTGFASNSEHEIVCGEVRNGRDYLVEQIDGTLPNGISWRRYRQDASGLYELDLTGDTPPACFEPHGEGRASLEAPTLWERVAVRSTAERNAVKALRARVAMAAILPRRADPALGLPLPHAGPDESTRLRYPLQIKARWVIRSDPAFPISAEVTGHEELVLPAGRLAGYKVRLRSPLYGPNDFLFLWYGREGQLQTRAHLELDIVAEADHVVGVARYDLSEWLTDYHLATPAPGFPLPLGGPAR